MAAVKLLNLDALVKPKRELVLAGKQHIVREMSVKDFIEINQEADKLEKETDALKQLESTIALVQRSIPTITRDELLEFDFERLSVVVKFINGEYDPGLIEQAQAGGEQKN